MAKWLEAVAYTLEAFPDEELERLAGQIVEQTETLLKE